MSVLSFIAFISLFVVAIAVSIGVLVKQREQDYLPWHETPRWKSFLQLYDEIAAEQYGDCKSHQLSTTFGMTQVYECGSRNDPPLFLFHGAGSNALIYGEWLVPPITEQAHHQAFVVDFVCDVGRSIPKHGNPQNCPATPEELVQWVQEIADSLHIKEPISMLGYSYGTTIAFLTALLKPQLAKSLILLAPASIFAPVEPMYLMRAVLYYLTRTSYTTNWFFRYMSVDSDFSFDNIPKRDRQQILHVRDVGATILAVNAESFSNDALQQVLHNHSTLLIVGQNETVNNGLEAAERARDNGAKQVKLYPNAGHLMIMEWPAHDDVVKDVVTFLQEQQQESTYA